MKAAAAHAADLPGHSPPAGARQPWAVALDSALGHLVEIPAALLVVAEIIILFSGIVARYVLHTPLVWSDELASILFLWLAMLGSVIAFRRGEHMRMAALVNRASPATRAMLDMVAVAAALAFLLMLQGPGFEYASEERYVTTAALEIPNVWRAAALPVSTALMTLIALLRLVEHGQWRTTGLALLLVGGVVALMLALQPALAGLGNANLLIFFVGIVAGSVFAGVPIAFAFGLATFGYLSLTTDLPMMVVVGRMDEGMSHLILLAVPLFVFLGVLIEMTGMAQRMVAFLASLLGHARRPVLCVDRRHVRGVRHLRRQGRRHGRVAPVLFPEMRKRGASDGDLVALLSATGAQTETVPPSLVLITIGSVTGVSITALFIGGLLPGLVLGVMLCLVVWWRHRHVAPFATRKATGREIGRALVVALPALALPFDPGRRGRGHRHGHRGLHHRHRLRNAGRTADLPLLRREAAHAHAGGHGLPVGRHPADHRHGHRHGLGPDAIRLFDAAGDPHGRPARRCHDVHGGIHRRLHHPGQRAGRHPGHRAVRPLLFPIAHQMGIHEVHYAMVVILSMGIGLFAPPFGVGYYAACAIGRVAPEQGVRPIMGYLASIAVGIVIVATVPWISTGFLVKPAAAQSARRPIASVSAA